MGRTCVLVILSTGCVAAPVPTPPARAVPTPCLVLETPCEKITPEQRRILDTVAELLGGSTEDQSRALRTLAGERAYALIESERLCKKLDECRETNKALQARIEQLESDLDGLKRLTIEMEMKAE